MPGALEAPELLDVEVQKFTRMPALVTIRRLGWLEAAIPSSAAMRVDVNRARRSRSMSISTAREVRRGTRLGADERSCSCRSPARQRANQRYTVRSEIPSAAATSATFQRS
jgi:hypothetical protein